MACSAAADMSSDLTTSDLKESVEKTIRNPAIQKNTSEQKLRWLIVDIVHLSIEEQRIAFSDLAQNLQFYGFDKAWSNIV